MRIKTLLCLAALTAGVATTMAQSNVYSLNIVGYVTKTNNTGYSIIANPLNATNNQISSLFANAPDNSQVFRFEGGAYHLYFKDPDQGWTDGQSGNPGSFALNPGEGVFLNVGATYPVTYVGEVQLGSTNTVPTGYSMRSSVIPQAGLIQTDLLYPGGDNDQIFKFENNAYHLFFKDPDQSWTDGQSGNPAEPNFAVGEGAFFHPAAQRNWIRNFTVGP
jgi:hypothetical protein